MSIPVENIYYLLCYAWNKLDQKELVRITTDHYTSLPDLLTRVLLYGCHRMLKKGIEQSYVETTTEVSGIKGKLLISETLKRNLSVSRRTLCNYDHFSADTLPNQLLMATLHQLTRTDNLDKTLKQEIRKMLPMFPPVTPVKPSLALFKKVVLHRNNQWYGFLMNVCELIFLHSLPAEQEGCFRFMDFSGDERQMGLLFEAFVRNFYRLEQTVYSVSREQFDWQFTAVNPDSQRLLPKMVTDISLENNKEKIIIDTKFYKETLVTHYEAEKIHSPHLYQLFSYLLNQRGDHEKNSRATGILLYPTLDKEYDLEYRYQQHTIRIRTINLHMHWSHIHRRMLEIIRI